LDNVRVALLILAGGFAGCAATQRKGATTSCSPPTCRLKVELPEAH